MDDASFGLVMLDRGTEYLDAFPVRDKTTESCKEADLEFAGPSNYIHELYTDGAPE